MRKTRILSMRLIIGLLAGVFPASPGASEGAPSGKRYIAYYFFGEKRCTSCVTIETYAEETLKRDFAGELASGRLTWKPVNAMAPENLHFIDDFSLTTQTIVLTEMDGEELIRWKQLDKVWQLLRNKDPFQTYVHDEVSRFMEN